jgi:hypothetical protein
MKRMMKMILALGYVLVLARPVLDILVVRRSVKAPGESGRWPARSHQTLSREFVPARGGGEQESS